MALNATHFRIARDLAGDLGVADLPAYYEGTLYPDTRYITGISRTATHNENCPQDPFASDLDDFQKGWAVHLLYDRLSRSRLDRMIPNRCGIVQGFNDAWIYLTAFKLVEDLQSCESLGSSLAALQDVHCTKTPRNESRDVIEEYLNNVSKLYTTTPPPMAAYAQFYIPSWDNDLLKKLFSTAEELLKDADAVEHIRAVYPATRAEMLQR